jgi:hypothetical protein
MSKTIYVDRKGNKWTKDNIEDLIKAFASFKDFYETFLHYSHRL